MNPSRNTGSVRSTQTFLFSEKRIVSAARFLWILGISWDIAPVGLPSDWKLLHFGKLFECTICFIFQLGTLMNCQCKICMECLRDYFNFVITNRNILNATCPVCSEPDLRGDDHNASSYFSFLDMLVGV